MVVLRRIVNGCRTALRVLAMWVDVSLLVTLLGDDEARRSTFSRAMARRGWHASPDTPDTYRVAFNDPENDDEVVQVCTRDVQNSAYVAGVSQFQATCLIAADTLSACDADPDEDARRSSRFDYDDPSAA